MDDETNLAPPEVEEFLEAEEPEGSTSEVDPDNPDGESEEAEPETVELEFDGKKYVVPVDLKDSFLRQADYTRKTQEIAAARQELTARIEAVQQAGEAEVNARAQVVAYEAALGQYQNVDWNLLEQQDPAAAASHFRQFMQLQNAAEAAKNEYQSAVERRTLETQHEAAKRIEQGIAELQRDIPGWGSELAEKLLDFGQKQFGLSREYMESVTDPALVKVIHHAFLAAKPQAKAVPGTPVKPAAKVKGGSAPVAGLDDRLSADEWMKRRNAQVRGR